MKRPEPPSIGATITQRHLHPDNTREAEVVAFYEDLEVELDEGVEPPWFVIVREHNERRVFWHMIEWAAFHVGLWKVAETPSWPPMHDAALVAAATHFDFPAGDCYERTDTPFGTIWEARHQERGCVWVRTREEAFAFLGVRPGTWTVLSTG